MRVRGEDLEHFSSVSLNATPLWIHKRVIKAGWGIFLEKLFLEWSRMDCSTIFLTFKLNPLTSAYKVVCHGLFSLWRRVTRGEKKIDEVEPYLDRF